METLVAVTIFAILAVVATQTFALSLRGVTKSQNITESRENIDHAILTIDRLLKSAVSCSQSDPLIYQDQYGNDVTIECEESDGRGHIASNSARLTSSAVDIDCNLPQTQLTCTNTPGLPDEVNITITGSSVSHANSAEGALYTGTLRTTIRNYSSD